MPLQIILNLSNGETEQTTVGLECDDYDENIAGEYTFIGVMARKGSKEKPSFCGDCKPEGPMPKELPKSMYTAGSYNVLLNEDGTVETFRRNRELWLGYETDGCSSEYTHQGGRVN